MKNNILVVMLEKIIYENLNLYKEYICNNLFYKKIYDKIIFNIKFF